MQQDLDNSCPCPGFMLGVFLQVQAPSSVSSAIRAVVRQSEEAQALMFDARHDLHSLQARHDTELAQLRRELEMATDAAHRSEQDLARLKPVVWQHTWRLLMFL